ncbi:MAG: DUF4974 domain-containing protein [Prevotella sp.]|nr:DUF4974 domain-containing protein [Prevotella sp.]
MKTPDKRLFLKMEEHPENYSEEELEAMMDYLDRMADADVAWQEFCCQHNAVAPLSSPLGGKRRHRRLQIAAVFAGVVLLSGIAFAAWQLSNEEVPNSPLRGETQSTPYRPVETQDSIVRFDNIRLDSVLTIVAQHYGKRVDCRNEAVRSLHFHVEWNQAAPLSNFITLINNFEGVSLREEQDTIIAE